MIRRLRWISSNFNSSSDKKTSSLSEHNVVRSRREASSGRQRNEAIYYQGSSSQLKLTRLNRVAQLFAYKKYAHKLIFGLAPYVASLLALYQKRVKERESVFVELDFTVVLNGNSSILALHDHTDKLTSSTFHVEYWDRNGRQNGTSKDQVRECHYRGTIQNHQGYSYVALSNCNGLNGLMQRDDQQYFIEPLWNVTIKSDQPHPHVIYQQDTDTYFLINFTGSTQKLFLQN